MIIEKVMNNNCVQASMNGQGGYHFWAWRRLQQKNMECRSLSIRLTGFFMSEMNKKQTL